MPTSVNSPSGARESSTSNTRFQEAKGTVAGANSSPTQSVRLGAGQHPYCVQAGAKPVVGVGRLTTMFEPQGATGTIPAGPFRPGTPPPPGVTQVVEIPVAPSITQPERIRLAEDILKANRAARIRREGTGALAVDTPTTTPLSGRRAPVPVTAPTLSVRSAPTVSVRVAIPTAPGPESIDPETFAGSVWATYIPPHNDSDNAAGSVSHQMTAFLGKGKPDK